MRAALTADQRTSLINAVKQRWSGVQNAGEPFILDSLIQVGVNGVILGQVEGANRASSDAAEVNFLSDTVNLIRLLSELLTK